MSKLQDWCKEISYVVVAAANGEKIQISFDGKTWADKTELEFGSSYKYRIKPRTIKIGDFDVPEPMRADTGIGNKYFTPSLASTSAIGCTWLGDGRDYELLRNGLCHETSEAAEVHAKALIALTSAK